jgi:hypothetical protein
MAGRMGGGTVVDRGYTGDRQMSKSMEKQTGGVVAEGKIGEAARGGLWCWREARRLALA